MNMPEPTEKEYLLQIERLLRNACMCRTDAQWLAFVRGEIEKSWNSWRRCVPEKNRRNRRKKRKDGG